MKAEVALFCFFDEFFYNIYLIGFSVEFAEFRSEIISSLFVVDPWIQSSVEVDFRVLGVVFLKHSCIEFKFFWPCWELDRCGFAVLDLGCYLGWSQEAS